MKKKKIIFLIILITILLIGTSYFKTSNLKNDYYNCINKKSIQNHKLTKEEYTWSTFSDLQKKADSKAKKITTSLIKDKNNKNINIIYNQLMDTNTRNNQDIHYLKPYIDKIDKSKTIKEYIENATYIENKLNIDIFTNIRVSKDYKNNNKNIIYLYPITMDFSSNADYYINPDYMSYKALLKQYGIKILKQYGYTSKKARQVSKNITNMYIKISNNSYLSKKLENIEKHYNIIDKNKLQEIYTNINIDTYLESKNIQEKEFSIVDINNYKTINSLLTEENLETLKESIKLKILENYSPYLSEKYNNLIYELNNKIQGTNKVKTKEEKAYEILENIYSKTIDKEYQEKYLNEKKCNYLKNMTKEIINYYKKDIKKLDWLSPNTKEKALLKLKKLKINIGIATNTDNYSNNLYLKETNSLVENIIIINKALKENELQQLKTNQTYPEISQTIVNAYYNPSDNSINFPTASTELFNTNNNYYENLGTIGMVIAHEITHAFDSNGSKFDETGNLSNWWTKKDLNNYKKLQKKVISYYNKYEVIDGEHINGKKTVNENIADLGAVSCISSIATSKTNKKSNLKKMYSSFAKMWASKSNKEYEKILLLQDTHSPAKYRVNGTLSSNDIFYKTYNINYIDKMYIKKEKRVKIW